MSKVRYLSPAIKEMMAVAEFYESKTKNLGIEFLLELQEVTKSISESPLLGLCIKEDIHRRLLSRFPYALLYRIDTDEIIILTVMHLRRNPDYWLNR